MNSGNIIDTFYNLRVDLDKLEYAFELTKVLHYVTNENEDTSKILSLFLNTLFAIDKLNDKAKLIIPAFYIKLAVILGFSPNTIKCHVCNQDIKDLLKENIETKVYYNFIENALICNGCIDSLQKTKSIILSNATILAINYCIAIDIKKLFSFELKEKSLNEFISFGQAIRNNFFVNNL